MVSTLLSTFFFKCSGKSPVLAGLVGGGSIPVSAPRNSKKPA